MAKQVMVPARLEQRPSDVEVADAQMLQVSLFAKLKKKPSLDKYPGTFRVRKYSKGEVVFRQGEAGWTAFYPLKSEDIQALRLAQLQVSMLAFDPAEASAEDAELSQVELRLTRLQTSGLLDQVDHALRQVATIHLAVARPTVQAAQGGWFRRFFGSKVAPGKKAPLYIPIDGMRNIDYDSLQAPIYEGELFGEMSCRYYTPRPGTVVATREFYMLELLRNILDQCLKDEAYQREMDENWRKKYLELFLQEQELFRDLTPQQIAGLARQVELATFEPGDLICDEHERADSMYLIRGGLVKVVNKASALLDADSVRSWSMLVHNLREGERVQLSPRGKVWAMLSSAARQIVRGGIAPEKWTAGEQGEVLFALNDVLKDRRLPEAGRMKRVIEDPEFRQRTLDFPAKRADWKDQQVRVYNRKLLEAVFPAVFRNYRPRVGPECVLSYLGRGEFFGEMGVVGNQARSASCVAHGHPQDEEGSIKETGQAQVVRIPAQVIRDLMDSSPSVRLKLQQSVVERQRQLKERGAVPVWDETTAVQSSELFGKLGLIQGQRLMLIDLNRCTRCDECVRACVDTHADGRSRLFLEGNRFGKFLVPLTCRSCLDPVCMIGCPVGSIHRGDNGQMVIEDWCIGCGLCANNCPYSSIQMHDIGVVPEKARGWRFHLAPVVTDGGWNQPGYNDQGWPLGSAPFKYDRDFKAELAAHGVELDKALAGKPPTLYFRYEFQLANYLVRPDSQFKMETSCQGTTITVWINGQVIPSEKPKKDKREYWVPAKGPATGDVKPLKAPDIFRVGRNVIAVQVAAKGDSDEELLLQLRLDEVRRPPSAGEAASEDVTQKLVTDRAVVCDLCSSSYGQVPACVNACPHDAAMRVDARYEFPVW